tara:strand:- start:142 stop:369 length:228 start_codon:yes stop_codon:yes gene_type:complete
MTVYSATFKKSNGQTRKMNFVKFAELPKNITNGKTSRNLKEGQELVWDVDKSGFRVLNTNTISGGVKKVREISSL